MQDFICNMLNKTLHYVYGLLSKENRFPLYRYGFILCAEYTDYFSIINSTCQHLKSLKYFPNKNEYYLSSSERLL